MIQAMTEALGIAQGKDPAGMRVTAVDLETVDAKAIRQKLHLTQDEMAASLGRAHQDTKSGSRGLDDHQVLLERFCV